MALTLAGFEPETFAAISSRIEARLLELNPTFDVSPDSPDGNLIGIFGFELSQASAQLNQVFNSYNPQVTSGAALRNIGLLTGLPYGMAERSTAILETQGASGTEIPRNSIVISDTGEEFYVAFNTIIPANMQVIAKLPGNVPVPVGSITTIKTAVVGWTSVTQTTEGKVGGVAQTEQQFRNLRQKTVMRNHNAIVDVMQARLLEAGVPQARVANNTDPVTSLPDGTPPNTIHVTVGELGDITHEEVAQVILSTAAPGCPTFGNTSVNVLDNQGVSHEVFFSVANEVKIELFVDVTYLSTTTAGAEQSIKDSLRGAINSLISGEDVVWSRLFAYITPYSQAQVNLLTIGKLGGAQDVANVIITESEFASIVEVDIHFSETAP